MKYLSGMSHIKKDSEYINRKQGKNNGLNRTDNNSFKVIANIFQIGSIQIGES